MNESMITDYQTFLDDLKTNKYKSITLDWYDGIVLAVFFSTTLERWLICQLCYFNPNTDNSDKRYLLAFLDSSIGEQLKSICAFDQDQQREEVEINQLVEVLNPIDQHLQSEQLALLKTKTGIEQYDAISLHPKQLFTALLGIEEVIAQSNEESIY